MRRKVFVRGVLVLLLLGVWVRAVGGAFSGKAHALEVAAVPLVPLAVLFLLRGVWKELGQPAFFYGFHPRLRRNRGVYLSLVPGGVLVRSRDGELLLRYALIRSVRLGPGGLLSLEVLDAVSERTYVLEFKIDSYKRAADFYENLLREQYREADAPWAAWRSLEVELAVSAEELRRGFRKKVSFTRLVACPDCRGAKGVNPDCPRCGGRGARSEPDVVELRVRAGTPAGREFVFRGMGNQDPNGRRGPLTVRLVCADPTATAALRARLPLLRRVFQASVPSLFRGHPRSSDR